MAFLKIVAVVIGLSVLAIHLSANALLLCFYPFSWSVSVLFCIMCVYYILYAHLLIMNEILEMFFPSFISQFPNFLMYFIFYIYGIHVYIYIYIYITVHTMEACNKDYYYYCYDYYIIIIIIIIILLPNIHTRSSTRRTRQTLTCIL